MQPDKPLPGSAADWLRHAESDLALSKVQVVGDEILPETLCFHAQQAVEKALKAVLVFHKIPPPKTHSIGMLIESIPNASPSNDEIGDAKALTEYAVSARYPGDFEEVTDSELEEAIVIAESVLAFAKEIIGKAPG